MTLNPCRDAVARLELEGMPRMDAIKRSRANAAYRSGKSTAPSRPAGRSRARSELRVATCDRSVGRRYLRHEKRSWQARKLAKLQRQNSHR